MALASIALAIQAACTDPTEGSPTGRPGEPATPPNILVFVTDDQRFQQSMKVMPRTRRWFERGGTSFDQAYVTTPLCCPSRASILTGQLAHNHGVVRNELGDSIDHRSTIQRYLRDAGYKTAIAGKYLQGYKVSFDPVFFDRWNHFSWGYLNRYFNVDGRMRLVEEYATTFLSRWANGVLRDFEREADDAPWFLYVAPSAPHTPYTPEPKYKGSRVPSPHLGPAFSERDRSDKPRYVRRSRYPASTGTRLIEAQMRTLKSVDDMVGKVFKTLKTLDENRDTLAFFMSDNGYLYGEHGLTAKRVPYTPAIHVPLYMRWPGRVATGVTDDRLAANIDVMPTIMSAAGLGPDERYPVDGLSLLGDDERDRLVLEQQENWRSGLPDWASTRTRGYQYVELYDRAGKVFDREYYDLHRDPSQMVNLLGDANPDNDLDVAALSRQLRTDLTCTGEACP